MRWRHVFARGEPRSRGFPEGQLGQPFIRMYFEASGPHHVAHFQAYYQDEVAVYTIDPVELLAGSLPKRQQRFVEAWAELHQTELANDWRRLQSGQAALPIDPLK